MRRIVPVLSAVAVVLMLCAVVQADEINSYNSHRASLLCSENVFTASQTFADSVWLKAGSDSFLVTVDDDTLEIYNDAGTCVMRIDSTGKVGLGTDTPAARLHIRSNLPELRLDDTDYQTSGYSRIFHDGQDFVINLAATGGDDITVKNGGNLLIGQQGDVGVGTTSPTAQMDINGTYGYDQLRMRASYTPSDSEDTNGDIGDIAWDDDYIYIKTSAGWKRAALSTF